MIDQVLPLSTGQQTYQVVGILETEQETIIATRNGEIVRKTVNDQTQRTSESTYDRVVGSTITKVKKKIVSLEMCIK